MGRVEFGGDDHDWQGVLVEYCPPLSNSWITIIIWLYIALNRTPNIDCYRGGGGGSTQSIGNMVLTQSS